MARQRTPYESPRLAAPVRSDSRRAGRGSVGAGIAPQGDLAWKAPCGLLNISWRSAGGAGGSSCGRCRALNSRLTRSPSVLPPCLRLWGVFVRAGVPSRRCQPIPKYRFELFSPRTVWPTFAWNGEKTLPTLVNCISSAYRCRREFLGVLMSSESDWKVSLKALQGQASLDDDGIGVLALQLKFQLEDIEAVAAESVTGGGDDKKCDVLYVDKELQIAVIAQCYLSKKARAAAPANKASDLNTAVSWLLTRSLDDLPDALKGRADELRSAIAGGEVKQLYVWYVHNLPTSANVAAELTTVEHTARQALAAYPFGAEINVFAEELGEDELTRLYEQAERTIIVTDTFETTVPGVVELSADGWSAISTVVRGDWLAKLYSQYGANLFSANLRGYLGSRSSDSNINNGIKKTAEEEPENFWVYNNGLTALVIDYEIGPRRRSGAAKIAIDGLSIVNGAQTTGSLGSIGHPPSPDLLIPIRFVRSNRDSIISNVVRYNNSQNKLQAADFRSTDSIQERLRREFEKIPNAEYEGGRRGGASDAIKRSKFTLPSYTVGQALSAFHGDPVTAYDKKSDIWTNESIYRRVFTERTSARHIVFCYSLLDEINSRRLILASKQRKDEDSLTQPEKEMLKFLNRKGASFLLVHVIASCMESITSKVITNKFDLQFAANISPAKSSQEWTPIVDVILSLSGQLDEAFSRNRISNESVKKAVPKFVGLINSLTKIHKDTFASFSKKVELSK
jgi:hypothetical protein